MIEVETSVRIRQPLQAVFAFVADTRNTPRWQIGMIRHALETAITTFETDRQVGTRSTSGPFGFDALYYLEAFEEGTQITWTCRLYTGEPYCFVEALIGQVMTMETEVSFMILTKLLEEQRTCGCCPVTFNRPL